MSRTKHNWHAIEADYVAGNESLRDLADRYGVVESNIKARSKSGSWPEKRAQHRTALAAAAAEAASSAALLGKAEIDRLAGGCIDLLLAALAINLGDVVRHRASFDMQDANHAMSAIQKGIEAKYRILGIPMPAQAVRHSGSVELVETNAAAVAERLAADGVPIELINAALKPTEAGQA